MEMKGKKILVTGATGILGSNLVKFLSEQGYDIRAMVRNGSKFQPLLNGLNLVIVHGDITNPKDLAVAMQDVSIVFHCAGLVSYLKKDRKKIFDVNVTGTKNVLAIALKNNVQRVIHISSVSATNPKSAYALSKQKSEEVCKEYQEKGLDIIIARPGTIYGRGDIHENSIRPFQQILNSKIIFVPPGRKSYVDVDDLARGIVVAAQKSIKNATHIFTSENHTFFEIYRMIAETSSKKIQFLKMPYSMYPIIKLFIGFSKYDIGTADLICEKNYFSYKDTVDQLCWTPKKSLKESVVEMLKFYKSVKLI